MQMFEAIPIILAMVAIFIGFVKLNATNSRRRNINILLGIVAATIMLIAQTSWILTLVYKESTVDTSFADGLWTWFNSIVMVLIISYSTNGTQESEHADTATISTK